MNIPLVSSGARRTRALAPIVAAVLMVACTEPNGTASPRTAPTPLRLARLEVSDSLAAVGDDVSVTVQLLDTAGASITARIAYDSTRLEYVGESPIGDEGTRAINPASGLVRFAAIAPRGFVDGRAYVMRFRIRRAGGLQSMQLVVEELHTLARVDATTPRASRTP